MKLTKRMKNAIIQRFFIQTVLFIVFGAVLAWYIYPQVSESLTHKKNLNQTQDLITQSEKQGISYDAFRQAIADLWKNKDAYMRTLLKNITPEFFSQYFTNTSSPEYTSFLQTLTNNISASKNDPKYIEKQTSISTILPVYSDVPGNSGDHMNDFDFVNSMENLLYTFNLSSRWDIGVGSITPFEEHTSDAGEDTQSANQSDLSEKIYTIPLNLDITGQKSDVLDFIHYFENVWKISIQDGDILVYNDKFIEKPLEGEAYNAGYNIYQHQVAEIRNLVLKSYPDSSSIPEQWDLITRMKETQWREKMQAEMDVVFYVVGIPEYQMEQFIDTTQETYINLQKEVRAAIQKYSTSNSMSHDGRYIQALQNMRALDTLLIQLDEEMKSLKKALASSQSLEQTYTLAYEYMQKLNQMQDVYDANMKILTLQNDNS